ncbi:hypothetical protein P0F26_003257 [Vibrio metschnikovii]|nr:hypothetical protein [Vibrio metschnikovii]
MRKLNVPKIVFILSTSSTMLLYNYLLLPWLYRSLDLGQPMLLFVITAIFCMMATPLINGFVMAWVSYTFFGYALWQSSIFVLLQVAIVVYMLREPDALK